jgi:hypothetical protein
LSGIAIAHDASNSLPGPRLELIRGSNGSAHLKLTGAPGVGYRVEGSPDNVRWEKVAALSSPTGESYLSEHPGLLSSAGFYRALTVTEEFNGPFATWANVKTDFGATGDGVTDDTAALQRGLNALRPQDGKPVLYLPTGVYRITGTVRVVRESHEESKDISILGEDPATTILRWDGATNGVMLEFGAWYSRLGRLTFDGRGKAKTAVAHGNNFATHNELTDLVFKDVAFGVEAGTMEGAGIAETVVARCRFLRCWEAGVSVQNWNSLDWFIRESEFRDCRRGVVNIFGAGNFFVYGSLFRNSSDADICIGNTLYFSLRNNTSVGSKAFLLAGTINASAPTTLQGNSIFADQEAPVQVGNLGPLLLFDNVIRTRGLSAVKLNNAAARLVSVGNAFTTGGAPPPSASVFCLDDRIAVEAEIDERVPRVADAPPRLVRPVFDLPAGCSAAMIQGAINQAAAFTNEQPVVHLPAGAYVLDRTLEIPTNFHGQLMGDGAKTKLVWAPSLLHGPMVRIAGPSHVVLGDLLLIGRDNIDGIVVENCDQPGGRVFTDQVDVRLMSESGLLADRVSNAEVDLHSFYHSGCKVGVRVLGTTQLPNANAHGGRVAVFGGASSDNDLSYEVADEGRLLVQDVWYETSLAQYPRFMQCTNSGTFTLHGANVGPLVSRLDTPVVAVENFRGNLTFLTTVFNFPNTRIAITGQQAAMNVLLLGNVSSNQPELKADAGRAASLKSFQSTSGGGAIALADTGASDADFVRQMLAQTRSEKTSPLVPLKDGVTDLRLHRVFVQGGRRGIHLQRAMPRKHETLSVGGVH